MKKQLLFCAVLAAILLFFVCEGCNPGGPEDPCPDCPSISSITPSSGLPGTLITIKGENFDGLDSIIFDGTTKIYRDKVSTTSTETKVIVPDLGKNGPISVQVSRIFASGSGNISTLISKEDIKFMYTQAPIITTISPTTAKKGETLVITGKFFGSAPVVKFPNGSMVPASTFTDSEIRIAVPSKAGSGKIQVLSGGQTTTSIQDFTYVFSYTVSTPYTLDGTPSDLNFSNGRFITEFSGDTWAGLLFIPVTGPFAQLDLNSPNGGAKGGGFRPDGKFVFKDSDSGFLVSVSPGSNVVSSNVGPSGVSGWSVDIAWLTNEQMALITYESFVTSLNIVQITGNLSPIVTPVNMYLPQGVCVFNGKIYATGRYDVSEIISNAASNVAGSNTVSGYMDGSLAAARFYNLAGIAMNEPTKIFVVDNGNHCIRLIDFTTNSVSTIAGTGGAGFADGPGAAAQFNYPRGICFDNEGNLFISDSSNKAIRKITIE